MTCTGANAQYLIDISTHTLTWSVTLAGLGLYQIYTHFNSHAHVERDHFDAINENLDEIISTHTLTWSVTNSPLQKIAVLRISTHTLTWSVTAVVASTLVRSTISTHTLTWSVTLDVVYIWCLLNVMRTYFFI